MSDIKIKILTITAAAGVIGTLILGFCLSHQGRNDNCITEFSDSRILIVPEEKELEPAIELETAQQTNRFKKTSDLWDEQNLEETNLK